MPYSVTLTGSIEVKDSNSNKLLPKQLATTIHEHDLTGTKYIAQVFSIPTADTTISLSTLTTPRYALFVNLDTTNFVEYGPDATGIVLFGRLKPQTSSGKQFPNRVDLTDSVQLQMRANTAACDVLVIVVEE